MSPPKNQQLQQFTFIRLHFYFFIPSAFQAKCTVIFSHHTKTLPPLWHLVASISPVQSSSNTNPSPTSRTYRSITRTNTNNTVGFSRPWFLITRRNHRGEQKPGKKTRKPRHTGFNQRRCATMRTMGNENWWDNRGRSMTGHASRGWAIG